MSKWLLALLLLGAAVGFGTPALQADHGHKNKHKNKHFDDDDDQGWQRREGYEYRTYGDVRPAGWSHGKKTGWKDCGLPPGQAKKYGCYTYMYEGRPHYYYQDEEGQIIVRRPIIEIHGTIDISQ